MNKIVYNDFAVYAEKYATVPAEGSSPYQSSGDLLNTEERELINYASFTGKGINLLDDSLEFAVVGDNVGYISEVASNSQRIFSPSVDLVIALGEGYYSAPGITLHFWQNYCTEFSVRWYQDDIRLQWVTFNPSFSEEDKKQKMLTFYGEQAVEDFNKIIISFDKSELPNQFVKLAGIDLGKQNDITDFHSNIELFFEIDPDAADVPGATCEFVAKIEDFEPVEAQNLYVYGKEKLFGKFTVKNVTPNGKNRYLIKCVDDVMNSDNAPFPAHEQGTYETEELITTASEISNIDFDASQIKTKELTGFVEADKTNRYAIAMIAFGTGCFVTGFGSKVLSFIKPKNRPNKIITADQILGKAEYKKVAPYTAISLNSFTGDFKTVADTRTSKNPSKKASFSTNERLFNKYSLMGDIDARFSMLVDAGVNWNEIVARIEYTDERLGDIFSVETPYNGIKKGIVKAMEITMGHKIIATLTLVERNYAANGGEG